MKRLISLLQMRRADFVDESQQQQQQQEQQQHEGPQGSAGAEGEPPRQQRQPEPPVPAQLDRRFLEAVGRRLIGNLHQIGPQDQHHIRQQAEPAAMMGVEGTAAPSTPSAKTMPAALDSPKIAAYRGPQRPAAFW